MSGLAKFKRLNTKKTSILNVGGFQPTGEYLASHFGLRPLATMEEVWPKTGGRPMLFVCQLNLTKAPFVPMLLKDVALITFFVDPEMEKLAKHTGVHWCLRAYPSLSALVPLTTGDAPALKRGFECLWKECDDHPNYDDPEIVVHEDFDTSGIHLENIARTKIGGYASSIKSEP